MKLKEEMKKYDLKLSNMISGVDIAIIVILLALGCIFSGDILDCLARMRNSIYYEKTDDIVVDSFIHVTGEDKNRPPRLKRTHTGGTAIQVELISYEVNGTAYTIRQVTSGLDEDSKGTKYTVRFDPEHPENAYVEGRFFNGRAVLGISFSLAMFFAAFLMIWREYRKVRQSVDRRKRWEQEGKGEAAKN